MYQLGVKKSEVLHRFDSIVREFDYIKNFRKDKFQRSVKKKINYVLMEYKYQLARNVCNDMDMEIISFRRDNLMEVKKASLRQLT